MLERLRRFIGNNGSKGGSSIEILRPAELARRLTLEADELFVGRDPDCGIQLDFPDISRRHARIYREQERWVVEDCGSKNGLLLNGERVGRRELCDGDLIKIGGIVLRFNGERRWLSHSDLGHVRKLLEVSRAISSSLVPDEVIERIIDSVAEISGAERAFLMLVNPEGKLELKVARNIECQAIESSEFKISRSVVDQAARTGHTVVIEQVPEGGGTESIEALGLKAVLCLPLVLKGRTIGVIYADSRRPSWIKELDVQILESLASHAAVAIENARLNQELKEAFFNTSMALAEAIEARDNYTAGHSRRVTEYSLLIGRAMGLDNEELEVLRTAAILHDVGKIGIEDCILRKAATLDYYEYAAIKRHPEIGARILSHVPQLARAVPAVRHHHERIDGRGYPDRLSGDEIPLLARIIAVADAFDAMASTRVYRLQLSDPEALEELRRCAGSQFDPCIVEVFIGLYDEELFSRIKSESYRKDSEIAFDLRSSELPRICVPTISSHL